MRNCDHNPYLVLGFLPPHRVAARVLQDALIQMVGDGDVDDDGDDANDGADNTQPCEPCEPAPEVTEQELVAAAYFARVREELGCSEMVPLSPRRRSRCSKHRTMAARTPYF